jgi:hypothetical protein
VLRDSLSSPATTSHLDGLGLSDWQSQFGEQIPDFKPVDAIANEFFGGSASAALVPEPCGAMLLLVGLLLGIPSMCRHSRHGG